ncbi:MULTISPECIES: nuclear transport factor 2 family protein [Shewanella]|uniref:Nuclear transport factor 2 family protein n=1 Tax=Shewanella marisflavi TaxID=260364 RepID=A0AAC9U1K6_9GAMM|nr:MULTISPECIES: nuclear transport factor 2 family protein [Shewanella]ASJ97242.1 nuclear transport factor 2 family protein [Shewanella marisflavi]QDF75781.1 nuclear transport factor 2 family protein [Shewanella marisflavi]
MTQALWLQNFIAVYGELGTDNLEALRQVYHPEVEFIDPLHNLKGLEELLDYFDGLYLQVVSCDFTIDHVIEQQSEAAVYWTMTFRHKQLNASQPIEVEGHSRLGAKDNKVIYHRDYFDLGTMLYEHLPVLGSIILAVKRRAVK